LRRMEARLNLIVFCFILMTHFQGHRSFFVNADAEPRIKHRQFISKARSDYIKQRFQGENQQSQNIVAKVESARVDPIKIPLCAYVEEKIEEVAEPQVNQTENKAFLDPQLGCISCQIQPLKQCVKKPNPQISCQMISDPTCQLCPKVVKAVTPKTIAFDITDQNEAFEKCDGNVTKDQFGRLVIYETKCKKFSSSRCKLARHSARQECLRREICYKKPRLLNAKTARRKHMKCKRGKSKPKKISLKKVIRRPAAHLASLAKQRQRNLQQSGCKTVCPEKEVCQNQDDVEECHVTPVRICDSLPPEKCQPAKPKFKRRIVLKCTEIAEIPPDLYRSLNANL